MRSLVVMTAVAACSRPAPQPTSPPAIVERTLTIDQVEDAIWANGPKATFAATTSAEHEMIERLVPHLFEAATSASSSRPKSPEPSSSTHSSSNSSLSAEAAAAGFRLEAWRVGGDFYWALLEQQVHGAGAYVFRVGPREDGPTILLEAPHNFYDLGTGRLAADVFFTMREGVRPRALFTNTIHRYQLSPRDKKRREHNPADIAHEPEHAFSIATIAFARAAGTTHVIQLHGFGTRSDDDGDGEIGEIAAVVSAGNRDGSSAVSSAIARALVGVLGDGVKRFPEEAKVLGATTNAQGKLLRDVNGAAFVHVEMSAAVRSQLGNDAALRAKLAAALFDARTP